MVKNRNAGKPRNYALESGVYRFGKSKMYHKKAVYKFFKKKTAKKVSNESNTFFIVGYTHDEPRNRNCRLNQT